MAWWEGMVTSELLKLEPGEIERILNSAFSQISHEQFMAATRAIKTEATRRGLLKVNQSA
ncbi:hypothetical protein LCGC14_1003230 [marine sediment metagenome]|uniref:Uncharacterized protein n=1 Tax=marine sediment metagenome TaxID=412755 RepID=A0A0F9QKT7_9ZZZZ